ncbi:MAG: hypothetical protein RBT06_07670 [Smithellaceae bacterium]|jgi:hypothetical protein|nr:hypothetical protein [Smithellaceae bacterium]
MKLWTLLKSLKVANQQRKKNMINIPIKTKDDAMKLFNLFKKKELEGLDKALEMGLITEDEKLRIAATRAAETLDKFLEKKGRKTTKIPRKP